MKNLWPLLVLLLIGAGPSSEAGEAKKVTFTHIGHACFLITTSNNTRVLTDPMKLAGYPIPKSVTPDIITVSHRHMDHDNVGGVSGEPVVLYGVDGPANKGLEHKFIPIDTLFGDVRIYNVVSNHFNPKRSPIFNAIFVFEFDGLRVAHLGDLGFDLNDEQLARLGAIDVLMIPVGGNYTFGPTEADEFIAQLKPRLVVFPMHYRTDASPFLDYTEEDFLKGKINVSRIAADSFTLDLDNLPEETQFIVMNSSGE